MCIRVRRFPVFPLPVEKLLQVLLQGLVYDDVSGGLSLAFPDEYFALGVPDLEVAAPEIRCLGYPNPCRSQKIDHDPFSNARELVSEQADLRLIPNSAPSNLICLLLKYLIPLTFPYPLRSLRDLLWSEELDDHFTICCHKPPPCLPRKSFLLSFCAVSGREINHLEGAELPKLNRKWLLYVQL